MDVATLKSTLRSASRMVLGLYRKTDPSSKLAALAQTVNRPPGSAEKNINIEWTEAFPKVREWVGERATQKILTGDLEVPVKAFEQTFELDRRKLELSDGRPFFRDPADLAAAVNLAWQRGRVHRAMLPIVENEITTWDNQNLIDTDHVHANGETFSNVLVAARSSDAAPTVEDAAAELEAAQIRLIQQSLISGELIGSGDLPGTLTVVVRSIADFAAYNSLLTEERIGGDINRHRDSFRLEYWYATGDDAVPGGTENYVDFIWTQPGGPRPVIYVPVKDPAPLTVDDSREFRHQILHYGTHAYWGFGAAFPHAIVERRQA